MNFFLRKEIRYFRLIEQISLLTIKVERVKNNMRGVIEMKTLRAQITLGFGIVLLLVVILGVNSFLGIRGLVDYSEEVSEEQLPVLITDSRLAFNIAERVALSRGYMLTEDEAYIDEFNELTEVSITLQEDLLNKVNNVETQEMVAKSIEWREILTEQLFPAIQAGDEERALEIDRDLAEPLANELMNEFDNAASVRQDEVLVDGIEQTEIGKRTAMINFIVAIIVIIAGIVISYFMARSISRPIMAVSERMGRMSEGYLNDEPLETKRQDEVGQQVHSINTMRERFQSTLYGTLDISRKLNNSSNQLLSATDAVSDSSTQIAATMEQLAAGAEAQANTATNMAEMVGDFFEDVQQANQAGGEVAEAATQVLTRTGDGNEMMESSVDQMNDIDQVVRNSVEQIQQLDNQTKEISELVIVISEIAEQTNLLALNAAIEAARAGEQGKGFAVVADEVRKLAEEVASSVSEITTIVDQVQKGSSSAVSALENGYTTVQDGKEKIIETQTVFEDITNLVTNMNSLTTTMSSNLEHIEEIGEQLTTGVSEVASIAEQSAAGVEETTASVEQSSFQIETINTGAEELTNLANELEESVNQFAIEEGREIVQS